jgi:hypothetical protein
MCGWQAVSVLRLPCIRDVSAVLLTRNAAFAAAESLTQLRLLDKGIPKQHMATVLALISPLNMMVPMLAAKWTSGARPMDALTSTFKFRAALRWELFPRPPSTVARMQTPTDGPPSTAGRRCMPIKRTAHSGGAGA